MIRRVLPALVASILPLSAADLLVEAESFDNPGGWKTDTQFILQMGSPFLLAHGLGTPVEDASTTVTLPKAGTYRVFVRTRDWVGPWRGTDVPAASRATGPAPGQFQVLINGKALKETLGTKGAEWNWQEAGSITAKETTLKLTLHDLTGFDGRCDAILFTTSDQAPPNDKAGLKKLRRDLLKLPETMVKQGPYDLVVVGGGYSGLGAAISGARQGLQVALIQDRPLLGGNGSSEIRVWAKGGTRRGKFPRIGEIVEEFADHSRDSPGIASDFVDDQKIKVVKAEPNIDLFLSHFAYRVETEGKTIKAVVALDVKKSIERRFEGHLFCDATGHGTIGAMAKADFEMTEKGHLGMSNMWFWDHAKEDIDWPKTPWALSLEIGDFPEPKASRGPYAKFYKGEWFWEGGFDKHPINDLERIRDWNLRAVFGAFSALKHGSKASDHDTATLRWVAYIGGNRESRRLMGDLVLTEEDVVGNKEFKDGTVPTTWDIDLHYPKEEFAKKFKDNPFISRAEFKKHVDRRVGYPIPYRCFYSRNVDNLFMAGRCISVTHEALGTIRVMRTCGMMGEVVGKAAWIARSNVTTPRGVYENYLGQLLGLLEQPGVARRDGFDGKLIVPDNVPPPGGLDVPGVSAKKLKGIVLDDSKARFKGSWGSSEGLKPFVELGYRYASSPDATATFRFRVKKTGRYEVRYWWKPHENRTGDARVTVNSLKGKKEIVLNLKEEPSKDPTKAWRSLGQFDFVDVLDGSVVVSAGETGGNLHVDCVQLVPVK